MPQIIDRSRRALLFECLGTLIFTYGVGCATLRNKGDLALAADGALVAMSFLAGTILCAEITDGHLNPLLSVAAHIKQPNSLTIIYLLGQAIGGVLGTLLFWAMTDEVMIPAFDGSEGVQGFMQILKYSLNELLGSILFALLALAATNSMINYATKSWQIYLTLTSCLFLVRKIAGDTILNPAIAVPAQLLAAILHPKQANPLKSLILLIPALLGGAIAGVIMKHIYEPLLLFKSFNQQLQSQEYQSNNDLQ